ncbi:hypothetical protein [Streptomyces sp. NPDC048623]|uniref:hypothetical protein n=1 Tax=Streptomyces sp. NPDC048623 TaxID=3155761 RepID=UPI0034351A1D
MRNPFVPHPVPRIEHRYELRFYFFGEGEPSITELGARRSVAARAIRAIRQEREKGHDVRLEVKHKASYVENDETLCFGCIARPTTWEWDCDGRYRTVTCDSDQCDWWSSVEARKK